MKINHKNPSWGLGEMKQILIMEDKTISRNNTNNVSGIADGEGALDQKTESDVFATQTGLLGQGYESKDDSIAPFVKVESINLDKGISDADLTK